MAVEAPLPDDEPPPPQLVRLANITVINERVKDLLVMQLGLETLNSLGKSITAAILLTEAATDKKLSLKLESA